MYSLPYALLMWGSVAMSSISHLLENADLCTRTLSFLAAFSFTCYTSGDNVVKVVISIAWVASCLLLMWTISVSFEDQPYYYIWPVRQWWRFEGFICKQYNAGREMIMRSHHEKDPSPV